MTKRIAANEAHRAAQTAAQKAAERQAVFDAERKKIAKLWSIQSKEILCAAISGQSSVALKNTLIMGGELERAGFQITETLVYFSERQLIDLAKSKDLLNAALESNTKHFIFLSKHNFDDEINYEKYVRNKFSEFLARASRLKDTGNDFALLNFLNSVSYSELGCDGGWNDFSSVLITINQIMHKIVSGFSTETDQKLKQIMELLPLSTVKHTRIEKDVLISNKELSYFCITWEPLAKSTGISDRLLTADRVAWLASKHGQGLMNFVFGRIEDAVSTGKQIIELPYRANDTVWSFEKYKKNIETITIDQMKEVLEAKGYRIKMIMDDQKKLAVMW